MKLINLVIALLLISGLSMGNQNILTIDFQEGFNGQSIQIVIDGRTVLLISRVHTNKVLDLAYSFVYSTPNSDINLLIKVNGIDKINKGINILDGNFLGINRKWFSLKLEQSRQPYLYD